MGSEREKKEVFELIVTGVAVQLGVMSQALETDGIGV
jgi:hypothetical protein